jgi:hypothetical protein
VNTGVFRSAVPVAGDMVKPSALAAGADSADGFVENGDPAPRGASSAVSRATGQLT